MNKKTYTVSPASENGGGWLGVGRRKFGGDGGGWELVVGTPLDDNGEGGGWELAAGNSVGTVVVGSWWTELRRRAEGGGRREGGDGGRGTMCESVGGGREGGERDMVWWGVGLCVGCEPLDEMNGEDGDNKTK